MNLAEVQRIQLKIATFCDTKYSEINVRVMRYHRGEYLLKEKHTEMFIV